LRELFGISISLGAISARCNTRASNIRTPRAGRARESSCRCGHWLLPPRQSTESL
jgi:hypothetical protein